MWSTIKIPFISTLRLEEYANGRCYFSFKVECSCVASHEEVSLSIISYTENPDVPDCLLFITAIQTWN